VTVADSQPPLAAEQAATLLDRLVYEQVLACIDLDELYRLEQSIALLAGELDGIGEKQATELARAMLDGALARLPGDVRRYLRAEWIDLTDCPLCEEEAAEDKAAEAAEAKPADDKSARRRARPAR